MVTAEDIPKEGTEALTIHGGQTERSPIPQEDWAVFGRTLFW